MCFNCGCEMPEDEMGNPNNITEEDFQKAAQAGGTSVEDAKKNTLKLLKKELGEK